MVLPGPSIPSAGDPATFLGYVQSSQQKNIRIPPADLIDKAEPGEEFPSEIDSQRGLPLSSSVITKSPLEGDSSMSCKFRLHVCCTFFDELIHKNSAIELEFHVLHLDCEYDIIVGNTASV